MSNHQAGRQRPARRGSAVGLLNVDDEAVYGDNANKYSKKKGSFLSRMKQNVGQKLEAATTKINMNDGVQMLVPRSGHYSADNEVNAEEDEWESDDDFESNRGFENDQDINEVPNKKSAFDIDFPNVSGHSNTDGQSIDVSQHSFYSEDGSEQFLVRSTVKSLGIKARSEEGSKARSERRRSKSLDDAEFVSQEKRRSNDNLLSRRLEDKNLIKIKYDKDEASILQFNPLMEPPKDQFNSAPFTMDSSEMVAKKEKSKSQEFTLSAEDGSDGKKEDKTRRKVRRNNSLPSDKVLRRAQRRSAGTDGTEEQIVKNQAANPRKHRRTKSSDDAPLDMSDQIDVGALVKSMKDDKKAEKKRASRSHKRLDNPSNQNRTLSTSGHSTRGLTSSSHHSTRNLNASAHRRTIKVEKSAPGDMIQPSSLDVRF